MLGVVEDPSAELDMRHSALPGIEQSSGTDWDESQNSGLI